jgi:DNA polymerase
MLNNSTRLQYLDALGVSVWQARTVLAASSIETTDSLIDALPLSDAQTPPLEEPPIPPAIIDEPNSPADAWALLQNEVTNCTKCSLCNSRTQTVFGTGNQKARWLIIGEAPGQSEDEQGKPFVGVAGQLLTEMLRAIELDRENDVFIANVLKCRPPNNRDPHVDELSSCADYLARQQALIKPDIILAVGRVAAQSLLHSNEPLSKLRGKIHELRGTPLVVVYHPAYLLRSLIEKRKAWQDLVFARQTMEGLKK